VSDDLEKITGKSLETPRDRQIAQLESDLQTEKDGRKTDRFIMSLVGLILFDAIAFQHVPFGGSVLLLLVQIVLMLVLARAWGFGDLYPVIINAIDAINRLRGSKNGNGLN